MHDGILTFLVGGIPCRDKIRNSEKFDHSVILRKQKIYLDVKIADLISYYQDLSFTF